MTGSLLISRSRVLFLLHRWCMRGNECELGLGVIINRMWSSGCLDFVQPACIWIGIFSFCALLHADSMGLILLLLSAANGWQPSLSPPWARGCREAEFLLGGLFKRQWRGPLGSFQQTVGGTHKQNKPSFLPFSTIFLTHVLHLSSFTLVVR